MSRSTPSRADAGRCPVLPPGHGGRATHRLRLRWARAGSSPSARLWRMACAVVARLWRTGSQTARMAIGIPDYDNYAHHVRRHHPEREPMGRDAFFRERMDARYGRGRSRCC